METKSNYILVGVITVALLAALVGFTVWLARFNDGAQKEYDIFFPQVNGLTKGTSVSFSGVPVGQIEEIKLWEPDPEYVRVRIKIDQSTPILQGTVATVGGVGFTGVSEILLDGAVKGAPPITCPKEKPEASCPAGAPVIPVKPGALGELLNNAPLLLERLSTLTERLTNILSDKNQESLQKTLANVESLTGTLAQQSPQLGDAITETQTTVRKFGVAADNISTLTGTANGMLEGEGKASRDELARLTLRAPFDGELHDVDHGLAKSVWVKSREPLAVFIDPSRWVIDAFIPEGDLGRIAVGQSVRTRLHTDYQRWAEGRVEAIDVSRTTVLPTPLLQASHGGPLAVVNDTARAGQETTQVARDALFRVRIVLDEPLPTNSVAVVRVQIDGEAESILAGVTRKVISVFIRESGF